MTLLDPMANDDEPGYIPTVDVIRVVRGNFTDAYVRDRARRCDYRAHDCQDEFDAAVSVELACRELLASQRWLLSNL